MPSVQCFENQVLLMGTQLPCRSVLLSAGDRKFLISPTNFSESQVGELRAGGDPTDILAPSLFHHLYVPKAAALFPAAKIWGSPGFTKKRPDIAWAGTLTPEAWPYADLLSLLSLRGMPKVNEVEFFHAPTKTLITADLCFNMEKPKGWSAGLILRAMGTYDGFAVSRLFASMIRDQAEFANSVTEVLAWDFERIIMCHGSILETGGKEALVAALRLRGIDI